LCYCFDDGLKGLENYFNILDFQEGSLINEQGSTQQTLSSVFPSCMD